MNKSRKHNSSYHRNRETARRHYVQLYANKFDNLREMDKFLEIHSPPKLKKKHNLKRPIIWSEKESIIRKKKKQLPGFPGGSVTNNPPANAGDMGLTSDSERSHMPWSN